MKFIKRSWPVVTLIMAIVILAGSVYLNALSNRYTVFDQGQVLDKWTGRVTYQGQFAYYIK